MNNICSRYDQQRMQSTLDPLNEMNGGAFDPSTEILEMTFNVILESACVYNPLEEERNVLLRNSEACLREYCLKRLANKFRKHVWFLITKSS